MPKAQTTFNHNVDRIIPEGWTTCELGDIAEIVGGGTPSTSVREYWYPPEIEWVTAKDVSTCQSAKIQGTEKRISRLGLENSSAKLLPPLTTVIIARGATMGKCRMLAREMAINQTCYGIVVKGTLSPVYLYYQLSNLYDRFRASAHGSVFDTVISSGLQSVAIRVPPTLEQHFLAKILSDLDSKIELNQQMNKTLEAIAKAVFKHWFIDFDFPDMEGKAYKSSGGEMVRNEELDTEIPKGWKVGSILDCANILSGGTPKTGIAEYWGGEIPWVSAKDVTDSHGSFILNTERTITQLGVENSNAKVLPKNTTVVTARGVVGSYCMLSRAMAINQTNYGLKAKPDAGDFFVFFSVSNLVTKMKQHSYGTIFDTITTRTFEDMRIPLPPGSLVRSFEDKARSVMAKILVNLEESRSLVRIRDTLLPKLMSGKIRVSR